MQADITDAGQNAGLPQPNGGTNQCNFGGFSELAQRVPVYGERTLRELVNRGVIPAIRLPHSRKLAFHWPSVEAALLRYQKGGIE